MVYLVLGAWRSLFLKETLRTMSNQASGDWVTLAAHGGALLGAKFSCELRIQHLHLRVKKKPRVIPCWVVVFEVVFF